MGYVAALLIIGLCTFLVAQPFFFNKRHWTTDEIKDDLDELSKENIFATINELEMEYNMGKLPKEDFEKLKKHYENLAAQKMREESMSNTEIVEKQSKEILNESIVIDKELEEEIEREIRLMRQKRKGK